MKTVIATREGTEEIVPPSRGSLLTADQVAAMLGVPKSWVYAQSRRGCIPTVTLGRYRRYRAEAIASWVARLEAGEGMP